MTLPVFANSLNAQQIAYEFSHGSVIGMKHYYAGGKYVLNGTNGFPSGGGATAIPTSGAISFNNLLGAARGLSLSFNGFNAIALMGGATIGVQMLSLACNKNGLWVALGRAQGALRINSSVSSNGTIWSLPAAITTQASVNMRGLIANNAGLFCAIASLANYASASYSTDGTTWSAFSYLGGDTTFGIDMKAVACSADGLFVQVGHNGSYFPYVSTSTDGMTFTVPVQLGVSTYFFVYGIAASPSGTFVTFGSDSSSYFKFSRSTDGINWSTLSLFNGFTDTNYGGMPQIAFAGGQFVVVMGAGLSGFGYCSTSPDGVTWSTPTFMTGTGVVFYPGAIAVNRAGVFVVIGTNASNQAAFTSSINGTTWTTPVALTGTGVVANSAKAIASNPAGLFAVTGYKASPYLPVAAYSN